MNPERDLSHLSESLKNDAVGEQLLTELQLNDKQFYVAKGFLPSLSAGKSRFINYSRVFDDQGAYFHPHKPSRLENILNDTAGEPSSAPERQRARACIDLIVKNQLSLVDHDLRQLSSDRVKGHAFFSLPGDQPQSILIFDQSEDDLLVAGAGASSSDFSTMLRVARENNPEAQIFLKLAQDLKGNPIAGYSDLVLAAELDISIIEENINTIELTQNADAIYVVNSLHGLEGILCGKPVYCFAHSFYGSWGLTHDVNNQLYERRERKHSVESLFAGIFFDYSRYLNPVSSKSCELEDLLAFLFLQKQNYQSNEYLNICIGFPPWKRAYVKRALFSPNGKARFYSNCKKAARCIKRQALNDNVQGAGIPLRLVQWGEVESNEIAALSEQTDVQVLRMEDGFVRSVGLGKYYIPPLSIVADSSGIYYNAQHASDLEKILLEKEFSESDKTRAANIVRQLNHNKITKYNVGAFELPDDIRETIGQFRQEGGETEQARVALVAGQVADDVSVKLGGAGIRTDLELLEAVRHKRPSVLLIYKPHPDVVSGNVAKDDANVLQLNKAMQFADLTVSEVDMDFCIQNVDELHCNTSLAGFEALMRGKTVYVYGKPFYAGWGLTIDNVNIERRSRVLSLNELVHGVLVDYPRYIDYETGYYITIEQALAWIGNIVQSSLKTKTIYSSRIGRVIRKIWNLFGSLIYGLRF